MQIFYFTGTGNSLAIARDINTYFEGKGKITSIAALKGEKQVHIIDDVVGFVFPSYGNDIPWFAKEFLLKLTFENNPYIFAVVDCSAFAKEGLASISGALAQKGQKLALGEVIQVHGNCVPMPEFMEQRKVKKVPSKLKLLAESVSKREVTYNGKSAEVTDTFVSETKEKLGYMTKFKITSDCTGCKLCQQVCQLENIKMVDEKPVHGDNCAACWACFHWCPQKAVRSEVKMLANRKRYHHPQISVKDM